MRFLVCLALLMVTSEAQVEVLPRLIENKSPKIISLLHCENVERGSLGQLMSGLQRIGGTVEVLALSSPETLSHLLQTVQRLPRYVWLDLDCIGAEHLLGSLSERKFLNGSLRIILSGKRDSSIGVLEKQNINIDSQISLLEASDAGDYGIYRVSSIERDKHTPLNVHLVGNVTSSKLEIARVGTGNIDLSGHTIPFAFNVINTRGVAGIAVIFIPRLPRGEILMKYMEGVGGEHKDNVNRFGNQYAFLLSELFNFRIHWLRTNDWGYLKADNKTFTGGVGFLQRREAVVSTAFVFFNKLRMRNVDAAHTITPIRMAFLFRHPKTGRGVGSLRSPFLRPFSNEAWICVTAVFVLLGVVLIVAEKRGFWRQIPKAVVAVVGILSQQGLVEKFGTLQAKIAVLFSLLGSVLLFQFYSDSIVGSLLTPVPKTLKSLDKITNSDLKVAIEKTMLPIFTYHEEAWRFYKVKIEGQETFATQEEAAGFVKRGWVYFGYLDPTYDALQSLLTPSEIDELQEVPFLTVPVQSYLFCPIQKYHPFKEMIRTGNLRIWESGLAEYWKRRWMVFKLKGNINEFQVVEVDMARVQGVMYLLVLGCLASLAIFTLEVMTQRQRKKQNSVANKTKEQ